MGDPSSSILRSPTGKNATSDLRCRMAMNFESGSSYSITKLSKVIVPVLIVRGLATVVIPVLSE